MRIGDLRKDDKITLDGTIWIVASVTKATSEGKLQVKLRSLDGGSEYGTGGYASRSLNDLGVTAHPKGKLVGRGRVKQRKTVARRRNSRALRARAKKRVSLRKLSK